MREKSDPLKLFWPWEAALVLRVSARTLERYRSLGTGPEYTRVGGQIRYSERALARYLTQNTVRTDQSDGPTKESDSASELPALLQQLLGLLPEVD